MSQNKRFYTGFIYVVMLSFSFLNNLENLGFSFPEFALMVFLIVFIIVVLIITLLVDWLRRIGQPSARSAGG